MLHRGCLKYNILANTSVETGEYSVSEFGNLIKFNNLIKRDESQRVYI